MKKFKRLSVITLVVAMVASCMPLTAFAVKAPLADVAVTANASWSQSGDALLSSVEIADSDAWQNSSYIRVALYEEETKLAWFQEGQSKHELGNLTVSTPGTYTIAYYAANLKSSAGYRNGSSNDYLTTTVTVGEVAPTVNEGLVYTGLMQQLLSDGSSVHYWIDSEQYQCDNIEDVIATQAGTYKIYYGNSFNAERYVEVTIAQADLDIVWEGTTTTYNGQKQLPKAYAYNADNNYKVELTKIRTEKHEDYIDAGTYDVSVRRGENESLLDMDNYKWSTASETQKESSITIEKAHVEITVDDVSKYYKDDDPEFTVTQTGVIESEEGLFDALWLKFKRDAGEELNGEYKIMVHVLKDGEYRGVYKAFAKNYEITKIHNGTLTIVPHKYNIIEGANQKFTLGSDGSMTFRCDGALNELFKGVQVDGKDLVLGTDYTVESGSTVVKLLPLYVKTLAAGQHTLTYVYEDGTVSTNFEIAAAVNTGDTNDMLPFAVMFMISIMGLAGYGLKKNN